MCIVCEYKFEDKSMERLFNRIVNFFFCLFMIVSITGAIIALFNSLISGGSSIYLLDFIIIIAFLLPYTKLLPIQLVKRLYKRHYKSFNFLMAFTIICWQIYLIYTVSGISSWDPSSLLTAATAKSSKWFSLYLSAYPNNFAIFTLYHLIWKIFGEPSKQVLIIIISVFNYVIFDLTFLFTFKFLKQHVKYSISKMLMSSIVLLVGISPWGCLTYSDLLAFDLTCLTIVSLFCLKESFRHFKLSILFALTSGLLLSIDYLIKPSLVITFIAFFIAIAICSIVNGSYKHKLLPTMVLLLTAIPIVCGTSYLRKSNVLINIDDGRSFNMFHYGAMGVYNNGGFNLADSNLELSTRDPKKRKDQDIKLWKSRLKNRGFVGYQSFLIRKQTLNTSDASFGWGLEGGFLTPFIKNNTLSHRLYFGENRPHYANIYFAVVQCIWIFVLFCMLFTISDNNFLSLFLKITFIGFCLFLLIFEGGRSRYMLQFLPVCFVLSGLGFNKLTNMYKATHIKSYK